MDFCLFSLKITSIFLCLILIFTFLCENFSLFITSFILGTSAFLLLTHSKNKIQVIDQEKQSNCQEDEFDHLISDQKKSNQSENVGNKGCLNVGLLDSSSESEIIDGFSCSTDEDFDFDQWRCSGRRADCSDGSISDEESLIEIELYDGQNVEYEEYKDEKGLKFCRRRKSPESVLCWPEVNEEENMIEIDLSVGSIKCSSIEIKA